MRFDFIKDLEGTQFFQVSEKEMLEVESALEMKLPYDLKEFLLEVGYGFLKKSKYNINRIMGPFSLRDARLKVNDFEFFPDAEAYEELKNDKVIFFEANESTLLLMELGDEMNNAIYYDEIKIANSLEEFLRKMMDDDNYYVDME